MGAGEAVAVAVLAGPVDVEPMMGVLDGGNRQAGRAQHRQHGDQQRGFAASRPADNAKDVQPGCRGRGSGREGPDA